MGRVLYNDMTDYSNNDGIGEASVIRAEDFSELVELDKSVSLLIAYLRLPFCN
jgi:hypothetical protein